MPHLKDFFPGQRDVRRLDLGGWIEAGAVEEHLGEGGELADAYLGVLVFEQSAYTIQRQGRAVGDPL